MRLSRVVVAVPLVALTLTLTGCSVSVAQNDLETEVTSTTDLTDVNCDGELKGEVDATQTCTGTAADGAVLDLVATVTSVDGSDVRFDIKQDVPEN